MVTRATVPWRIRRAPDRTVVVGAGPLATLATTHGETVPFLLHSAWMPAFHELADAERLRFSDELNPETLATVPQELHAAIHAVAEECDNLW